MQFHIYTEDSIRILMYLAVHPQSDAACIADGAKVSSEILPLLISKLTEAGIIRDTAGAYQLCSPLSELNLLKIAAVMEPSFPTCHAPNNTGCPEASVSPLSAIESCIQENLENYLRTISLSSLLPAAPENQHLQDLPAYITGQILNVMDAPVYIYDTENYEVLFANDAAKQLCSGNDIVGRKCYAAFKGRTAPCESCQDTTVTLEQLFSENTYTPASERMFATRSRVINYCGRCARLKMTFDITEWILQQQMLQTALNSEQFITGLLKEIYTLENISEVFSYVVESIGKYMRAERCYVFEIHGEYCSNTYEWCNEGTIPQRSNLQNLETESLFYLISVLKHKECYLVEDIETLKDTAPVEYDLLKLQEITNCVIAPLFVDSQLYGFIGIDNAPLEALRSIRELLLTLSFFISTTIQSIEQKNLLHTLSYTDSMTGVANRNAFIRKTAELSAYRRHNTSVGVAFFDMNNLKIINDTLGHSAGDRCIIRLIEILRSRCSADNIYRIGGDEFLVILTHLTRQNFMKEVDELRSAIGQERGISVSIGAAWNKNCNYINETIQDADQLMYQEKRLFHSKTP